MLVNKELYAFKSGSPVSAYKIACFTSNDHLVMYTLDNLPSKNKLYAFSVSYVADNIVLTGGGYDGVLFAQTYLMDLQMDRW